MSSTINQSDARLKAENSDGHEVHAAHAHYDIIE